MRAVPITEMVSYLDENHNPVENESQARYIITTTFNDDNSVKDTVMEVILYHDSQEEDER